MIELRLAMPAPAGDIAGFLRVVGALDPDAIFETTLSSLVAKAAIPEMWPRLATGTVLAEQTPAPPWMTPDPEPVEDTAEDDDTPDDPDPVPVEKPAATRKPRKGRSPAAPGTVGAAILECLDRHDGRFEGSVAELAREAHPAKPEVAVQQVRKFRLEGLVRQEHGRGDRWVTAVELTGTGWEALGDRAVSPRRPGARPDPDPGDAPAPPLVALSGLGPIERRPFDPQRVRDAQAAMS